MKSCIVIALIVSFSACTHAEDSLYSLENLAKELNKAHEAYLNEVEDAREDALKRLNTEFASAMKFNKLDKALRIKQIITALESEDGIEELVDAGTISLLDADGGVQEAVDLFAIAGEQDEPRRRGRYVTVNAKDENGSLIVSARDRASKVLVEYKAGEWSVGSAHPLAVPHEYNNRAARPQLIRTSGGAANPELVAVFEDKYEFEPEAGFDYFVRISDRSFTDNDGEAAYEVTWTK